MRVGEVREGEVEFRGDAYFASPHFLENRRGMVTFVKSTGLTEYACVSSPQRR